MKIKRLGICNYKSIRKFVTNLSTGINLFIGRTDSGKSNIIRAIRDVCFNARGLDFITSGKNICKVIINDVTWVRSKKLNKYSIDDDEFNSVGAKSPQEIKEHLRMNEIDFGQNFIKRLQFIEQFDNKFFLEYPDSINARILGKVSGIERIYDGHKAVIFDKRVVVDELKYINQNIQETEEELEQYKSIDKKEEYVKQLASIINKLKRVSKKYNERVELRETILNLRKQISNISEDLKKINIEGLDISKLEIIERKSEERSKMKDDYRFYLRDIKETKKELEDLLESEKDIKMKFSKYMKQNNVCPLTKHKYYDNCIKEIVNP